MMLPNSTAWQIIFEALRPKPDLGRLQSLSINPSDEQNLLRLCRDHGILLIVNQALKSVLSQIFSAETLEQWRTEVATHTLRGMTMHRELQRLLDMFAAAEIPVLAFKGPVLSEALYGDPVLRMFADLDFLTAPENVVSSVELLIAQGYGPINFNAEDLSSLVQPGSIENHCILRHPQEDWLVEVHWELFDVWRKTGLSAMVDGELNHAIAADTISRLLYLCLHGSHHWWISLKWVVDVDRCVRTAHDLDWDALFSQAEDLGCLRIVRLSLLLDKKVCGLELPEIAMVHINRDSKVEALASSVACFWPQPKTHQPSLFWKFRYLLACRERFSDKLAMIVGYPLKRSLPWL